MQKKLINKNNKNNLKKHTKKKNVMGPWQSEACSQHNHTLETQTAFILQLEKKKTSMYKISTDM